LNLPPHNKHVKMARKKPDAHCYVRRRHWRRAWLPAGVEVERAATTEVVEEAAPATEAALLGNLNGAPDPEAKHVDVLERLEDEGLAHSAYARGGVAPTRVEGRPSTSVEGRPSTSVKRPPRSTYEL